MLPNPIRKGAPSRGAIALALILLSRSGAASEVVVFAAASLTGALEEIVPRAQFAGVSLSFASSSSLARQIEAGAPADLYFSASSRWMDYLEAKNLIEPATRVDILTNSLILITPPGAAFAVHLRPDFDFAAAFSGRLALADPDHVPAGVYARQALEALGWWPRLGRRLAPAPHVLAALVYVERGECPVGITTQDPDLTKRLDSDEGAERVANFINSMTMETTLLTRSLGKGDVHSLEPEDLAALTIEASAMARVPLVGTNKVFGE